MSRPSLGKAAVNETSSIIEGLLTGTVPSSEASVHFLETWKLLCRQPRVNFAAPNQEIVPPHSEQTPIATATPPVARNPLLPASFGLRFGAKSAAQEERGATHLEDGGEVVQTSHHHFPFAVKDREAEEEVEVLTGQVRPQHLEQP